MIGTTSLHADSLRVERDTLVLSDSIPPAIIEIPIAPSLIEARLLQVDTLQIDSMAVRQPIPHVGDTALLPYQLPYDIQPIKPVKQHSMLFYLLVTMLGIFAYSKNAFGKYVGGLYQSFTNLHLAQQFFKDNYHNNPPVNLYLQINVILAGSILGFLTIRYLGRLPNIADGWLMLLILGFVATSLAGRYLMLRLAALILPAKETILFYLFNLRIINSMISLLLAPLLIIIAFSAPPFVEIGLITAGILIGSLLIYNYYRGLIVGEEAVKMRKFHFFIYLCTFEIAPVIILLKAILLLIY